MEIFASEVSRATCKGFYDFKTVKERQIKTEAVGIGAPSRECVFLKNAPTNIIDSNSVLMFFNSLILIFLVFKFEINFLEQFTLGILAFQILKMTKTPLLYSHLRLSPPLMSRYCKFDSAMSSQMFLHNSDTMTIFYR